MKSLWTVAASLACLCSPVVDAMGLDMMYEMHEKTLQAKVTAMGKKTSFNFNAKTTEDSTSFEFDQLIDHNNPSTGTFKQRYHFDSNFYKPGGPLIFMTGGEVSAKTFDSFEGYLHYGLPGELAEETGGAVFIVEERYFGKSRPTPTLRTSDLVKYHNVDQALRDFAYFMRNVQPGVLHNQTVIVKGAKWLTLGVSWPGSVSAWLRQEYPDLVFAAHSSSAPIQAIEDFWQYFEPIRLGMPRNCSADITAVVDFVDWIIRIGEPDMIWKVKSAFGLEEMTFNDDFAHILMYPVWEWQSLTASHTGPGTLFYDFCAMLSSTTINGAQVMAPPQGWGLEYAFNRYSVYIYNWLYKNGWQSNPDAYFGTHCGQANCSLSNTLESDWRPWAWLICNEFGFWQTGAPPAVPTLVSRQVTAKYWQDQCGAQFNTDTYTAPSYPAVDALNQRYGGWSGEKRPKRIIYVNGEFDPWRSASSDSNYGAPRIASTPDSPDLIVSGGIHGFDLQGRRGQPSNVASVASEVIQTFKRWLSEG